MEEFIFGILRYSFGEPATRLFRVPVWVNSSNLSTIH